MKLSECARTYAVPDEDFYDDYADSNFDLIVFEEFKHQKTVQWMNKFIDGQVCPLRQKGSRQSEEKPACHSPLELDVAKPIECSRVNLRYNRPTLHPDQCQGQINVDLELTSEIPTTTSSRMLTSPSLNKSVIYWKLSFDDVYLRRYALRGNTRIPL